jgi:hypothetical protein
VIVDYSFSDCFQKSTLAADDFLGKRESSGNFIE